MPVEKFRHPAARIGGCLLVVFQPVTKHGSAGLELRVVETVVNAGVDDLLDRHPVGAPGVDFLGAVCRRRPLVEGSNKNERGDHQAPRYGPAQGIKCNHCTKPLGGYEIEASAFSFSRRSAVIAPRLSVKLFGRTNSSNEFASATKRVTQPPCEKPTAATRCGSTKVWRARKARAP